jgi:hypothetical protein
LSITKSIIELLGGRIWVESILKYGSIFYFEIPIPVMSSSSTEDIAYPEEQIDFNCFKVEKILIAEDVDYNFIFLREGLLRCFIKTSSPIILILLNLTSSAITNQSHIMKGYMKQSHSLIKWQSLKPNRFRRTFILNIN